MKKVLLSMMAILLITIGGLTFAQERDWIEHDVDAGTITVYSPDKSYGIVIQDKNLGATVVGGGKNAPAGSYGNYYQWGNNYGFPSDSSAAITKTSTKVDASTYGPENPYLSSTFIRANGDWSSSKNDNLRGGEGDDETNGYGLTSNNPITGRQGPCPEGYHVPSIGERNELTAIWYNNRYNGDLTTDDLLYLQGTATLADEPTLTGIEAPISIAFSEDLLVPYSTYRWYDDGTVETYSAGLEAGLWSSSPYGVEALGHYLLRTTRGNPKERYFEVAPSYNLYRAYGLAVRCFRNERAEGKVSNTLTLSVESGDNVVSTGIDFTAEPLTSGQVLGAIEWLASEVELATGYHFTWYTETGGVETEFDLDTAVSEGTITSSLNLTGQIEPNKYTISFLDENGAEIMSGEFTYDQAANLPANTSTKEGYTFKGWKDSDGNTYDDGASIINLTTEDGAVLKFTPIREENPKPSGGGSSGGGGRGRGSRTPDSQADTHGSADNEKSDETTNTDQNTNQENNNEDGENLEVVNYNPDLPANQQTLTDGLTPEIHDAYRFAYRNGITTMPTIQEADMYGHLDRISMAKMLSQYAINILGKTPDTSKTNQFVDVPSDLDAQYNNGVTLAYQLGIMGINMHNNEFRPFDLVPRSEFGTALSRMLYQLSDGEYEKTDEFYTLHFEKLKEEGIMTLLDPYMEEIRGYVMIMLMRSAEKN